LIIPYQGRDIVKSTEINSIHVHHNPVDTAVAGEHTVGLSLTNFNLIRRGYILTTPHDPITQYSQKQIIAQIMVINFTIKPNSVGILSTHSETIEAKFTELKMLTRTKSSKKETILSPTELKRNEQAHVTLTPTRPFLLDIHWNNSYLSYFTGFMQGKVAFLGRIYDIVLNNGSLLSKHHKWARVRLLFIASVDPNSTFPLPKDIIRRVAEYLMKS